MEAKLSFVLFVRRKRESCWLGRFPRSAGRKAPSVRPLLSPRCRPARVPPTDGGCLSARTSVGPPIALPRSLSSLSPSTPICRPSDLVRDGRRQTDGRTGWLVVARRRPAGRPRDSLTFWNARTHCWRKTMLGEIAASERIREGGRKEGKDREMEEGNGLAMGGD